MAQSALTSTTASAKEVPILAAVVRRSAHAEIVRIPRATSRDARRVLAPKARAEGLALTGATLAELAGRSRGDLRLGIGALARLRFDRLRDGQKTVGLTPVNAIP